MKVGLILKNTVIDLMSGIGGLSIAFRNVGAEIVFANVIDKKVFEIYKSNVPECQVDVEKIENLNGALLPDADIIVGSIPFQGFSAIHSISRNANSVILFYEIRRIIREKKPKAFLFETDKSLEKYKKTDLFIELKKEGYYIKKAVMGAKEFGNSPYLKERLYIVGFSDEENFRKFVFPAKINLTKTFEDMIYVKEKQDEKYYKEQSVEKIKLRMGSELKQGMFYQYRYMKGGKFQIYELENCPSDFLYPFNVTIIKDSYGVRMLTPREFLRLQGIKDDFYIPENSGMKILYRYVSRSSLINVSERIAKNILCILRSEDIQIEETSQTEKVEKADQTENVDVENQIEECEEKYLDVKEKYKQIFLSYCQKDKDIADLIESELTPLIKNKAKISRDIRDVEYHGSFKNFMQSIEKHDFVIMLISDNYLKSRNCMFEVSEAVKDKDYARKIVYIILKDEDIKYYKDRSDSKIGANIYSVINQAVYNKYWQKQMQDLKAEIDTIQDLTYATNLINEQKMLRRISSDIPEFMEFLRDCKSLSLSEHIENKFSEMIKFMGIK